jgi:hypothetical protein
MPKNKSYKTSSYWYPKPTNRKPIEAADKLPETLSDRLKIEDKDFDKQWDRYWRQRGKWASFEEFLKAAA